MPDFAARTEPLRKLLAADHRPWGPEHTACVRDTVKHILEGVPFLNFAPEQTTRLEVRVGPVGLAGVLL